MPDGVTERSERWKLLSLHRERVVSLMRARGVSREDAEDSVHDALLQLMVHPALDSSRAGSLLTVVAMRRAYDRQRSRLRERHALRRIGRFADVHVSPADTALDRVEAAWIAGHVAQLPARQRDVVVRQAGGLSGVEAARSLGITAKAAESALSRARITLRAMATATTALSAWILRRLHDAPGPASVATATLVAGLLTTTTPAAPNRAMAIPDDQQSPVRVVSVTPSRLPGAGSSVPSTPLTAARAVQAVARSTSRGGVAATTGTTVAGPAVQPGIGVSTAGHSAANNGTTVHRYDGDTTFAQSLQTCVAQGVSLDTSHLGCPPR